MTRACVWSLTAVFSASIAAVGLAQAPALDVRMGLWEVSSTTDVGGQGLQVDTSKMTPEQRAQMEQAMKGMMGAHTNVTKSCMTREKFEKQAFMNDERGRACKQTIVTNTRSAMESTITCTGEHPMNAQMHIDAPSPTAIKGTIKSTTTMRGGTMNVNMTLTGKWLGADCGDVK